MSGTPLVSVVIPVYNGESFLTSCLNSVLDQTWPNLEVVIVDDGSTDRSLDVANAFTGRKQVISMSNGDVARARNAGILAATGEYIALLDQDDMWKPTKTEKQMAVFLAEPEIDLVFTNLTKFFNSGKTHLSRDKDIAARNLTDRNLFGNLVMKNVLMPSAVIAKKKSLIDAGLFDETYRTAGDYELWLRMAARGMKFRYIPEPLTLYRYHGGNTSRKTQLMHEDRVRAVQSIFNSGLVPAKWMYLKNRALGQVHMIGAQTFYSDRNYEKFLENFYLALRYSKTSLTFKAAKRWLKTKLFRRQRRF
ncbi:MAG: glycosyltransferase [Bacteroidetes bacterium]|nr:glycosyltransferase [Bacteroidota bacterium]